MKQHRSLSDASAAIRYKLYRASTRLLLGRVGGGALGSGVLRDVDEKSSEPAVASRILERRLLAEAQVATYAFPECFPPWFRRSEAFAARPQYKLRDVALSTESGAIWIPDFKVFQQSVGSLPRLYGPRRGILGTLASPRFFDCCAPVVVASRDTYYHWLLEILPEVLHAINFDSATRILVPPDAPPFVRSSLAYFVDDAAERTITIPGPVRVPELVLTPRWVNSGFVPPEDVRALRSVLAARLVDVEKKNRRIYVSRSQTKIRTLVNEAELERALRSRGFEIVHAETLDFGEQMALCASARHIVAPHGAGLSNMIACRSPLSIHEIIPCTWVNDCYARLALHLGFAYSYTLAKPNEQGRMEIPVADVLRRVDEVVAADEAL